MKKIVLIIAMLAIGVNTQAQSVITETAEGNVGIGTTTPKNKNETVAVPTVLHVKKVNTSGDVEVARFEGGNDSDNTAAIVRINHSNDRGLYLKGGRRNSDRSFGEIGIIGTSGNLETPSIIMNDTGEVSFTSHITSKRAGSNTFLRFNDYGYSGYGSASTLGSGANILLYGKSASRADVIALRNSAGEKVTINANGNVGIGTTTPEQKLDIVDGSVQVRNVANGRKIKLDATNGNIELTGNATVLQINRFSTNNIALATGGGNVAVGTLLAPTGYKLAVAGKTITEEVKVQLQTNWPDYVFKKDYKLPTLTEVEQYINEKGHLKNIPSAKEVKDNGGIELGKMNAKLLQKIEELTLYTIEQEKEIKKLKEAKKENNELKERLSKLEKLVQKLL